MQVHEESPSSKPLVLSVRNLRQQLGLSKATILRLERAGRFPRQKQLSPRRIGWLADDVASWLRSRNEATWQ